MIPIDYEDNFYIRDVLRIMLRVISKISKFKNKNKFLNFEYCF